MPISRSDISAVLLAGGKGSRFDNQDKGLLNFAQKPLVETVIDVIQPQVENLIISANRNLDTYLGYGYPVVEDEKKDFQGPLAGILAALNSCETEWLVTVPVDCPFVPKDLVKKLSENINTKKVAIASDGNKIQPTFCLIHRSLRENLKTFLQQGHRKTGQWLKQQPHLVVTFDDSTGLFLNINSQQDLDQAIQLLD